MRAVARREAAREAAEGTAMEAVEMATEGVETAAGLALQTVVEEVWGQATAATTEAVMVVGTSGRAGGRDHSHGFGRRPPDWSSPRPAGSI